jgi:hypothetical protein
MISSKTTLTLAFMACTASALEAMPPGLYELTTETAMPHLEENLRYAITHEERCLDHQDLASAFPVLTHSALADCRLGAESRVDDLVSYSLLCDGGHGTTGAAQWRLGARQARGTLNVRLGGKNMTFQQHVTAKRLGDCPAGGP